MKSNFFKQFTEKKDSFPFSLMSSLMEDSWIFLSAPVSLLIYPFILGEEFQVQNAYNILELP